jgi:hypothetical protein
MSDIKVSDLITLIDSFSKNEKNKSIPNLTTEAQLLRDYVSRYPSTTNTKRLQLLDEIIEIDKASFPSFSRDHNHFYKKFRDYLKTIDNNTIPPLIIPEKNIKQPLPNSMKVFEDIIIDPVKLANKFPFILS